LNFSYTNTKGLIVAIVPQYGKYGTNCKIIYENGETEESNNRVKFIMKQYLSNWGTAVNLVTAKSENTSTTGTLPFAVTLNHTFIPLKVRRAQIKGDQTYGLFWHERIEYSNSKSRNQVESITCNKTEFNVLTTHANIQIKRKFADLVQKEWKKLHGHSSTGEDLVKGFLTSVFSAKTYLEKLETCVCDLDFSE
jgi:hypothetical protein